MMQTTAKDLRKGVLKVIRFKGDSPFGKVVVNRIVTRIMKQQNTWRNYEKAKQN
jgi:hypothetical protein